MAKEKTGERSVRVSATVDERTWTWLMTTAAVSRRTRADLAGDLLKRARIDSERSGDRKGGAGGADGATGQPGGL